MNLERVVSRAKWSGELQKHSAALLGKEVLQVLTVAVLVLFPEELDKSLADLRYSHVSPTFIEFRPIILVPRIWIFLRDLFDAFDLEECKDTIDFDTGWRSDLFYRCLHIAMYILSVQNFYL